MNFEKIAHNIKKAEKAHDKASARRKKAHATELAKEKSFDKAREAVGNAKLASDKVKKVEKELAAVRAYEKAKHVSDKAISKKEKAHTRLKAAVAKLPK